MKQQFKLKKDGYYKAIKQSIFIWVLILFFIITQMWGIFYFTGSLPLDPSKSYFLFIPSLTLLFTVFTGIYKTWYREYIQHKYYRIVFDTDSIFFEQIGIWEETAFFFWSSYNISKRRIPYKEITDIKKNKTGYYTIKGDVNSSPNTIIIPAQIENMEAFEVALSEIQPIINDDATKDVAAYKFGKVALKKQMRQFFNSKTVSIILGAYFMVLLFSYFWFHPINWSLTLFLSVLYFSATFVFLYGYFKAAAIDFSA